MCARAQIRLHRQRLLDEKLAGLSSLQPATALAAVARARARTVGREGERMPRAKVCLYVVSLENRGPAVRAPHQRDPHCQN